jgi:hypothetical protein
MLIIRHLERLKGCRSAPLDELKENPYYRDFLESIYPWQGLVSQKGRLVWISILRGTLFLRIKRKLS